MEDKISNLEPKVLWNHFADINAIPRPSKKEEKAIQFLKEFGEKLGLTTYVDKVGNVIISKPATKGKEKCIPVILQGHIDMVAQKNEGVDFDFEREGIKMVIDGDWVKADGTTLGADNGIGVAAAMSVLSSDDIAHGPLEVLVTMDEETGMTGAKALEAGKMKGKIMLNLDSEDENELTIGCAGGIDVSITGNYEEKKVKKSHLAYKITLKGLKGGHSGMEIHLGRGNANKIMNRILFNLDEEIGIGISYINGGGLRNAIPRESKSLIVIKENDEDLMLKYFNEMVSQLKLEYKVTDPDMEIFIEEEELPARIMKSFFMRDLLSAIYSNPNGIYRMSPDVAGLVQTSNNLARVFVEGGTVEINNLTRSSVDSEKMDLANAIKASYIRYGADISMTGSYPGWAPDPNAGINKVMSDLFEKEYGKKPLITACHAGLECGIIKNNYPDVDMISFGPNIRGPHSPDEKVQISSVNRFWIFLKNTLENIPEV
ncbi:MAG TPA: cytosol nonspecific dipeptidase [Saprospirales bacterium]|nr:cytosol nonspecific dipeptidase [Saprospirales bacterium]